MPNKKIYYLKCADCMEKYCHRDLLWGKGRDCVPEVVGYIHLYRPAEKKASYSIRRFGDKRFAFADEGSDSRFGKQEIRIQRMEHYETYTEYNPMPKEHCTVQRRITNMYLPDGNLLNIYDWRRKGDEIEFEVTVHGPNEEKLMCIYDDLLHATEPRVRTLSKPLLFYERKTGVEKIKAGLPPFSRTKRAIARMKDMIWAPIREKDGYESRFMDLDQPWEEYEEWVQEYAARSQKERATRMEAQRRRRQGTQHAGYAANRPPPHQGSRPAQQRRPQMAEHRQQQPRNAGVRQATRYHAPMAMINTKEEMRRRRRPHNSP